MKYLLLLLAPVFLSSSRDQRSDSTKRLLIWNFSDCNAGGTYKVCNDAACTSTSEGYFQCRPDESGGVDYTGLGEGWYFCSLTVSLGGTMSYPLYLDSRCGSGYVAVDCDGETVTVKKVSESASETKVEIDG